MSVCETLPCVEEADVSTPWVVTPASVQMDMNSRPMERLAKVFIFFPLTNLRLREQKHVYEKKSTFVFLYRCEWVFRDKRYMFAWSMWKLHGRLWMHMWTRLQATSPTDIMCWYWLPILRTFNLNVGISKCTNCGMNLNYSSFADINECRVNNGGCSTICQNNPGSYICVCNEGYQIQTDGTQCEGKNLLNYETSYQDEN